MLVKIIMVYGVWALVYYLCISRQSLLFIPRSGLIEIQYFIHDSVLWREFVTNEAQFSNLVSARQFHLFYQPHKPIMANF